MRIIQKGNLKLIIWHAIILLAAISVRYNALIYPFIAIFAFSLSGLKLSQKIIGIASFSLPYAFFILFTGYQYKDLTGTWQFSPFSGWQLANNGMYAYRYVNKTERKEVPKKYKELDQSIRLYFDSTRDVRKYPVEGIKASTFYMWSPGLPLNKYMESRFLNDTGAGNFKKWASMGPLYSSYGSWLIRNYPLQFAFYFLWPNTQKYFSPPVEFLETYNGGKTTVKPIAKDWFRYKSTSLYTRTKNNNAKLLCIYPILTGIINLVYPCCIICFFILKDFKTNRLLRNGIILTSSFWLLNAVFSIFSTAAALRFLAFPILLVFSFCLIILDWFLKLAINSENQNTASKSKNTNSISIDQTTHQLIKTN